MHNLANGEKNLFGYLKWIEVLDILLECIFTT